MFKNIILILSIFLFFTGCEPRCEPLQEALNHAFAEKDGLEYYIQTDNDTYGFGGTVNITYRITNKSSSFKLVGDWPNLGAACPIFIRQSDKDIFRLPPTPYEITKYYLAPQACCDAMMQWEMNTWPDFKPVEPGVYTVVGKINGVSVSVNIEIQ